MYWPVLPIFVHVLASAANIFILLTVMCHWTVQREVIVDFSLQQWLREGTTMLHYTYIACLFFLIFVLETLPVNKGKGKAIPLQAWVDPAGSRRLRLPDFKTVGT